MSFSMTYAPRVREIPPASAPAGRTGSHGGIARPRLVPPAKVAARREDGSLVCLSDLPDRNLRWTRGRKRAVVDCVEHGLVSCAAVCRRYGLTPCELDEWRETRAAQGDGPQIWRPRPRPITRGAVRSGRLSIDLDANAASIGAKRIGMSPSEWRLLAALAEAGGAVVTTAMLLGALYGRAEDAAGPKIADVLICRLRKRLGSEASRIVAVWGRGYRLDLD